MGSPRGRTGSMLGDLNRTLTDAGTDFSTGLRQVGEGNIETGLSNMVPAVATAAVALGPGGAVSAALTPGLLNSIGLTSPEERKRIADFQRLEQGKQEAADAAARQEARVQAVRTRIDQEVALRLRSPGRSQTMLTGGVGTGILPSARNTLLSPGGASGR